MGCRSSNLESLGAKPKETVKDEACQSQIGRAHDGIEDPSVLLCRGLRVRRGRARQGNKVSRSIRSCDTISAGGALGGASNTLVLGVRAKVKDDR